MIIIDLLNRVLNLIGAEIIRYPNENLYRRKKLFERYKINKVLDVGANVGNYGLNLKKSGFNGKIISFEPLSKTFIELEKKSHKYKDWNSINIALGDFNGNTEINIANNNDSSSILDMLPAHLESAPYSKYIGKEKIQVKTLDSIYEDLCIGEDVVYLKIDTQGFEKQVLDGAIKSLSKIKGLQVEMSLVPLYSDSITYIEMINFLKKNNFILHSIEPGFFDQASGKLLQFDGIFYKD